MSRDDLEQRAARMSACARERLARLDITGYARYERCAQELRRQAERAHRVA